MRIVGLIAVIAATAAGCAKKDGHGESSDPPKKDGHGESLDPRYDPAVTQDIKDARDKIVREYEDLGEHPWAGVYDYSEVPGLHLSTLWIAPKAGAVFKNRGDVLPLPEFTNYGSVEEKDGKITVQWRLAGQDWLSELLVVRWGEHHYLVPSDEILRLCRAVEAGIEPNRPGVGTWCYIRDGDLTKPTKGDPELPKGYEKYWKMPPIVCEVTKFGSEKTDEFNFSAELKIDAGRAEGVVAEMHFKLVGDDEDHRYITIDTVREHESDARMECTREIREKLPVKVGAKLSANTVPPKK